MSIKKDIGGSQKINWEKTDIRADIRNDRTYLGVLETMKTRTVKKDILNKEDSSCCLTD